MANIETLAILSIVLPWAGALLVRLVQDRKPSVQHGLAVVSALAGAVAAGGHDPVADTRSTSWTSTWDRPSGTSRSSRTGWPCSSRWSRRSSAASRSSSRLTT